MLRMPARRDARPNICAALQSRCDCTCVGPATEMIQVCLARHDQANAREEDEEPEIPWDVG